MGDRLTFFKGDEHRAKIEREFRKDDFFSGVFDRACRLLMRIINEEKEYEEENQANGYRIKYQGMSKNIILFTSERGQGKTSAMQSFAELLRYPENDMEKASILEKNQYIVLDAVDPSSLDQKENLIRVLISRLFFILGNTAQNNKKTDWGSDYEERSKREKLLMLFRNCYDNLEVLREGKNKEYLQDDLEHLAQLGNSARMKENLHELVKLFIDYMTAQKGRKEKPCYLVVQIDDVDLFSGNVFQLCEDVQHYLSVPNVIIMMAADYTQLYNCIYERYLKQYQELKDSRSEVDVYRLCREQAVKYLEKVFPEGYRIELPTINQLSLVDYARLKIFYGKRVDYRPAGKRERINDYLLQQLYERTGIVLLSTQESVHPLIPCTMRSLVGFLEFLDSLSVVDFETACGAIYSSVVSDSTKSEIRKLKTNLQRLKQYFIDYWCTENLSGKESEIIRTISKQKRNRILRETRKELNAYLTNIDGRAVSYHTIMRAIKKPSFAQQYANLQFAIYFYYTLILNEWFADGLEVREELAKFASFLKTPVYLSPESKYSSIQFSFSVDKTLDYLEKNGQTLLAAESMMWLKSFTDLQGLKKDGATLDEKWYEDIIGTDQGGDLAYFDIYRAVISVLLDEEWQAAAERVEEEKGSAQGTYIKDIIIKAKNIMCNYEVQCRIEELLESESRKRKKNIISVAFDAIDSWAGNTIYQRRHKDKLGNLIKKVYDSNGLKTIFPLLNSDNYNNYYNAYSNYILEAIENLLTLTHQLKDLTNLSIKKYETFIDRESRIVLWDESKWADMSTGLPVNPMAVNLEGIAELNSWTAEIKAGYNALNQAHIVCLERIKQNPDRLDTSARKQLKSAISKYEEILKDIAGSIESRRKELLSAPDKGKS